MLASTNEKISKENKILHISFKFNILILDSIFALIRINILTLNSAD